MIPEFISNDYKIVSIDYHGNTSFYFFNTLLLNNKRTIFYNDRIRQKLLTSLFTIKL